MPSPIRVLNIFSQLARGGAELRILELAQNLDRRRYQLDFCVLSDHQGELEAWAGELGSVVYHVNIRRWGFSSRFRKLLEEKRFDVVHSHVFMKSGLLLRLAAQCGTPVRVAHFHCIDDDHRSSPARIAYRRLMRHWIDRYATNILAASGGAMTQTWGPGWQADPRCQAAYNGVDLSQFARQESAADVRREFGIADHAPFYLHVGRITRAKNHFRLLDIFVAVRQRQPDAVLLLAGKGDPALEHRLRQHIAAKSLERAVILAGERTDVPRLLAAADAMIFPSLSEGLGCAVLEANAAGTPVVASDLPCIREVAEQLSGIECMSLAAADEDWAEAVLQAARHKQPKDLALLQFAQSAFTLQRCASTICEVWETARRSAREAA